MSKLLPPVQFEKRMRNLTKDVILNHDFSNKIFNVARMVKHDFWGLDRFSAEHWIGSHPDLTPCDVAKNSNLHYWFAQQRPIFRLFDFGMAPRKALAAGPWVTLHNRTVLHEVLNSTATRMREYVLLPGVLHRWFFLYNKAPGPESWVWKW